MSKGSKRRPGKGYEDNWDLIFKRKKMIEIYGKPRCPFCDRAKALCEQKGLEYTYKMLDADFTAEEMFERAPNAKTFPQIIINNEHVGGYNELEKWLAYNSPDEDF